jgi:hypothetical protein
MCVRSSCDAGIRIEIEEHRTVALLSRGQANAHSLSVFLHEGTFESGAHTTLGCVRQPVDDHAYTTHPCVHCRPVSVFHTCQGALASKSKMAHFGSFLKTVAYAHSLIAHAQPVRLWNEPIVAGSPVPLGTSPLPKIRPDYLFLARIGMRERQLRVRPMMQKRAPHTVRERS